MPAPIAPHGRPPNVYRQSPSTFEYQWNREKKVPFNTLFEDKGFGLVGHMLSKMKVHQYRAIIIPTTGASTSFWVKLETVDNGVEFSFPSPIAVEDLPRLLEQWEVYPDEAQWCSMGVPLLASPIFPEGWRTPVQFNTSPNHFLVLTYLPELQKYRLMRHGGIHSLKARGMRVAGILGYEDDWEVWTDIFLQHDMLKNRLKNSRTNLNTVQIEACRAVSTRYAASRLLECQTKEGTTEKYLMPFIPHSEALRIPLGSVSKLVP